VPFLSRRARIERASGCQLQPSAVFCWRVGLGDKLHDRDKTGDEMPDWIADKKRRAERIRQAKAELEAEAKAAAESKLKAAAEAQDQSSS
jgi:hypothetical protein